MGKSACACQARTTSCVLSVEPSSTTTHSKSRQVWRCSDWNTRCNVTARLYVGVSTVNWNCESIMLV
ncbi:Uncharacterised protein [Bordetella pertussis]|nr:Uncharacterised protein [Bordetella pertussis]